MTKHWQELLPIDRYMVTSNGLLHDYDRKIIAFLYQPLIGSFCFSLYMTLWAELEENRLSSKPSSHYYLMNIMDSGLRDIYHYRLKLEGIGLLKTFVKQEDENRSFIYELQTPLTPEQFFEDGLLSIYLYRKIGKQPYAKLKAFFSDQEFVTDSFQNVTRSFQDIYSTSDTPFSSISTETEQDISSRQGERFISRDEAHPVVIDASNFFDFELFESGIKRVISIKAITPKVKEAIGTLSFLYGIDAIQMKNIVLDSLTHDDEVDVDELRIAARNWYRVENGDKLPLLIDRIQPPIYKNLENEPETLEEKRMRHLEMISPRQLLSELSGGASASKGDLELIEEIMFKQKLHPGVVNVLIEYVMLKTDMKLSKGYVEKIASHWSRKQVKTVKEAFALAKNEHRQYISWQEGKKEKGKQQKAKTKRTELVPEWFEQNDKIENKTADMTGIDYEEEKKRLQEELKKFKRK